MTEIQQIERDPRWWASPWWEEVGYQTEYQLSLKEIRAAVDVLRSLFDETWTQSALSGPMPNVVLAILYGGQGLMPFENLMWLGRIALGVSRISGVASRLGELCGPKTRATLFELEVASWLVEAGWNVEFVRPARDRKTPDLKAGKGDMHSWIECKRFESEQWEDWASELTHEIIRQVHERAGSQLPSFDILFEPRLSDLTWQGDPIRRGILEELAACIWDAVRRACTATPPTSVRVPGIDEVRIRGDRDTGQQGMGGIQISPQAKMRRIAKNGILQAAQQLASCEHGAVVVYSDFTPPKELVDVVLGGLNRADRSLLQSVGLVVIPGSLGAPPVIWRNPGLARPPGAVCRDFAAPQRVRPTRSRFRTIPYAGIRSAATFDSRSQVTVPPVSHRLTRLKSANGFSC